MITADQAREAYYASIENALDESINYASSNGGRKASVTIAISEYDVEGFRESLIDSGYTVSIERYSKPYDEPVYTITVSW